MDRITISKCIQSTTKFAFTYYMQNYAYRREKILISMQEIEKIKWELSLGPSTSWASLLTPLLQKFWKSLFTGKNKVEMKKM